MHCNVVHRVFKRRLLWQRFKSNFLLNDHSSSFAFFPLSISDEKHDVCVHHVRYIIVFDSKKCLSFCLKCRPPIRFSLIRITNSLKYISLYLSVLYPLLVSEWNSLLLWVGVLTQLENQVAKNYCDDYYCSCCCRSAFVTFCNKTKY